MDIPEICENVMLIAMLIACLVVMFVPLIAMVLDLIREFKEWR